MHSNSYLYKNNVVKTEEDGIIDLSNEEMGALIRYKSFDSYIINNTLRNTKDVKKVDAEQQQFIKMKDSALSKMPKYKGNLFKTVDFSD